MSQAVSSPDFVAIITNAGVLLAALGTVVAAIWSAVKKIKTVMPEQREGTKLVGGAILDTTSILMWSESNRDVAETLRDVNKELMELRFAVTQLKDKMG